MRVIMLVATALIWVPLWLMIEAGKLLLEGFEVIRAYWGLRHKRSSTHGDAAFATPKELSALGHFERRGWLVGEAGGKPVYTLPEASGLAVAPKGEGKSQTAIAQLLDLASRPESEDVIVLDPAGDLHLGSMQAFQTAGYEVKVLDFEAPDKSDWYDALTFVRTLSPIGMELDIDAMCMLQLPPDEKTSEEHFGNFARALLAGTYLYMLKEEPEHCTVYNVAERLTTDTKQRNRMFEAMGKMRDPLIRQAVSAFSEAGDREKGSFATTMARKLKPYLRTSARLLTESDEIDSSGLRKRGWSFEGIYLGSKPTVIFLITGLGTGTGDVARLILGNAINTRRYMYNTLRRQTPPGQRVRFLRPLKLLIDEAKTIGNCRAIIDANDELRKAQTTTMMYWLSSRDTFNTYPDAVTLIQNSDLFIFGGSKEKSWSEDVSWMAGEKTIENPGYSENEHGTSESFSEQAQRLIKPDAVRRLAPELLMYISNRVVAKLPKPYRLVGKGESRRVEFYLNTRARRSVPSRR